MKIREIIPVVSTLFLATASEAADLELNLDSIPTVQTVSGGVVSECLRAIGEPVNDKGREFSTSVSVSFTDEPLKIQTYLETEAKSDPALGLATFVKNKNGDHEFLIDVEGDGIADFDFLATDQALRPGGQERFQEIQSNLLRNCGTA